ncbi:MAG: phosphatase PAP2 family protein [Ruminococcus sp.]|nr:phosphatase PAP2 family protein [Ruminococcus sp.]
MLKKLRKLDALIISKISKLHNKVNNRIMAVVTILGTGIIWFLLCVPLALTKDNLDAAINIVLALFVSWIVGEVTIKSLVGRVRPIEQLPEEEHIIKRPRHSSFPSGHTSSAFSVLAVVMVRCNLYVIIPVLIMACLVSFSRLYLRVHYLTDVLAGVVVGFVCGFAAVGLFDAITHNLLHIYLA